MVQAVSLVGAVIMPQNVSKAGHPASSPPVKSLLAIIGLHKFLGGPFLDSEPRTGCTRPIQVFLHSALVADRPASRAAAEPLGMRCSAAPLPMRMRMELANRYNAIESTMALGVPPCCLSAPSLSVNDCLVGRGDLVGL